MKKMPAPKSIIGASVALVTFLVFLPSLRNGFINWDDNDYVFRNYFIRSLDAHLLKSAFGEFYASNWHPVTWLSHAFDYAIWGLNPLGHHLTNNILHAVNTFIVVILVVKLIEAANSLTIRNSRFTPHDSRFTLIAAAITGLLFGLHPIHVESVAWVAERKDLLCAFFFLLSIMMYTGYIFRDGPGWPSKEVQPQRVAPTRKSPKQTRTIPPPSPSYFEMRWRYFLSLFFFTLALMSKPMAVSLPFVLLILDWRVFGRIKSLKTFWTASIEKLPFLALTLVSSVLTISAQRAGGAMKSIEDIPLDSRVIVAAKALISYLVNLILPLNLVPFYPYPESVSLFSPEYIMPVLIVPAITAACIAVMRRQGLWISAWGYYVITLIPVLGLVQVGHQAMADRYAYLPSLGPFLVIGFMSAIVYEKVSALSRWKVMLRNAVFFIALTVLASLSYATIKQISIWKNSIEFWNYVIDKEPSVALAHNNLGQAYISEGRFTMAVGQIRTALSLKPNDAGAYSNLGAAYLSQGLFDAAMEQYRTALSLEPNNAGVYYNIGYAYLSRGQVDSAIEQFRTALRLRPNDADAYNNLGLAYFSRGELDVAIEQFRTALSLEPNSAEVHYNLGDAYFSGGQLDMAIEQFRTALTLTRDFPKAHYKLGLSYLDKGLKDMARTEFEAELKNKPDDYEARQALNSISL